MNNLRKITIAAALLALVATGVALAGQAYSSPYDALRFDNRLNNTLDRYERQGYTFTSQDEQVIYYLVQPSTPYVWGTMTYTYSRPCDPGDFDICLGTDYAVIEAEVTITDQGALVSKVTTTETTVY